VETSVIAETEIPKKTKRDELIGTIKHYQSENLLAPDNIVGAQALLNWLLGDLNAELSKHWDSAISNLKAFETLIPVEGRLNHKLY
jgi:hypothetical protein